MKYINISFLFFILLVSSPSYSVQPEYETSSVSYLNALQSEAFKHYWKMEFDFAKQALSKAKHKSPNDPYNFFVQSFGLAVELVLDGDRNKYFKYKSIENKWLDSLGKLTISPQRQHTIASVKLHWALLKSVFGEGISAAWNIRQAYQILGDLNKSNPNFKPAYVYYGVLNVALSSIPDNYHWAAQLTGLVGNKSKGLQLLEKARESDPNLNLEASIALLALKSHLEFSRNEILNEGEKIVIKYANYDVTNLIVAWIFNKNNNSEESKRLLELISNKSSALIAHTKGVALLQTLEYAKAKIEFLKFLRETKGNSLKKDTYYKLSQVAILENDTLNLSNFRTKIEKNGNDNLFADKFALIMLKYPSYYRQMLVAKLYCDGGLFEKSITQLQLFKPTTAIQRSEMNYYLGVCFEQTSDLNKATKYFKECVLSSPRTFYVGPLACVRQMKISIENKDNGSVIFYAKKLQGFKNYDFKKHITEKANALLEKSN